MNFVGRTDIEIAKMIKEWLISDDWNEPLKYPLHEYAVEEIEYNLHVWKDKIDLMRNVISSALYEMSIQLNDAMIKIIDTRQDEKEYTGKSINDDLRESDDTRRIADINSTIKGNI